MARPAPYASPRIVTDPKDCTFYHSMDIPGFGAVVGEWDLRRGIDEYLGRLDFAGRRVLEIGPASGLLSFEMEKRGAEVVSFDLSDEFAADLVPFARVDAAALSQGSREGIRRFNNAYWFAHQAYQSRAKVVYGSVYDIPEQIGPVDIVTFGCVLEHLRDPFHALAQASRFAKEAVLVTGLSSRRYRPLLWLSRLGLPWSVFLPHHRRPAAYLSWWLLSPALVKRALGVLGFEQTVTTYHSALYQGKSARLFTVVGRRTAGRQ